jgi:hypothetical protein
MQIDNMLRKTSPGSRDIMSAIFNTDYTKKVLINILTFRIIQEKDLCMTLSMRQS